MKRTDRSTPLFQISHLCGKLPTLTLKMLELLFESGGVCRKRALLSTKSVQSLTFACDLSVGSRFPTTSSRTIDVASMVVIISTLTARVWSYVQLTVLGDVFLRESFPLLLGGLSLSVYESGMGGGKDEMISVRTGRFRQCNER
jgi:hypothetical protein